MDSVSQACLLHTCNLALQTLKLNFEAAKYEEHPLFHYIVKECTLEEA